jgi:Lon protease-like protein
VSDALDKVDGIRHLPIFPLPLVMLPGEIVPLHIFEERYRQMLRDVATERNVFGITLFEPDGAYLDRPAVGAVGCVAEIREIDTLPDGRSNIITYGVVRYRSIDYVETGDPYLVADVEFFEDTDEDDTLIQPLADEVFALFERMARAAFKLGGSRGPLPEIHQTDPESLSFLITAAFNFDNARKYELLAMTSTLERLNDLKELLDRTVVQMEASADIQTVSRLNGHSKKKIDL